MPPIIVVVDYHKGNLSSVERSLIDAGADVEVCDNPKRIADAGALVLPGVGSFYDAMCFMNEHGQSEAILEALNRDIAFLGICLGQHLLFERGDEGVAQGWMDGLGIFRGSITRLESTSLKVPHVGWNQLEIDEQGRSCPLLQGVASGANVYFTHSYATAADIDEQLVAARTNYTREFASCVWRNLTFAVQFHPEKSSATGMQILGNFVALTKEF